MEDLGDGDARALLAASHLGVLCLADGGRSYAVPLYYSFDGDAAYFQCHPGVKDQFMAATREACLVVHHVESKHIWESVQAFGPVERLTLSDDLDAARSALAGTPYPPLAGNYPGGLPRRSEARMYHLRLRPTRISGKASTFHDPKA